MFANNPVPIIATHNNPLINIRCNPDPYAIFHDGMYYVYSTGYHGVNVLRSKDLQVFEHMGFALSDENRVAYWAPAVFEYSGLFYMYYSSMLKGETDPHREFMQVAVAGNPLGPFIYQKTFYDEFSIDAHVIEKNGMLYLFYAANRTEGDKIGTMVMLDALLDPLTPACKPRVILAPTIPQEISAKNRPGYNRDWYTLEGGFYFEHKNIGFLMYSANGFENEDYFVGYALCDTSVPLDEAVFTKYPNENEYHPLIGKDAYMNGCGHNSVITGLDGELLIVYHGRDKAESAPYGSGDDGRRLCIAEIKTNGKQIEVVQRI